MADDERFSAEEMHISRMSYLELFVHPFMSIFYTFSKSASNNTSSNTLLCINILSRHICDRLIF
jgi:hypothetical protein